LVFARNATDVQQSQAEEDKKGKEKSKKKKSQAHDLGSKLKRRRNEKC
jgi:hypothetical protein